MHEDASIADRAMAFGASAYVVKGSVFDELLHAIRTVHSGGKFISPSMASDLVAYDMSAKEVGASLTNREEEVLVLIAKGLTNRQIGERLGISMKTVDTHRTRMMKKFDLHKTADLVKYAVKKGLID